MTRLRIGIAGVGAIASHFHLPILQASPLCELAGLAEADPLRLSSLTTIAPKIPAFPSWQALLAEVQLDALVVCLPPQHHLACGLAAIAKGLAVYMEKPLTLTLEEARQLTAAASQTQQPCMTGFNFRFHPAISEMKAQCQAGHIGQLLAVRGTFTTPKSRQPGWRKSAGSGASALLDLAVHHVDLFRFLTGEEVTYANAVEHDGGSRALLQLRSTTGVLFDGFFAQGVAEDFRLELIGDKGQLTFTRHLQAKPAFRAGHHIWTRAQKIHRALHALHPENLRYGPGHEPSFALALAAFLTAASNKTTIKPDFSDGLRAQQVLEDALQ